MLRFEHNGSVNAAVVLRRFAAASQRQALTTAEEVRGWRPSARKPSNAIPRRKLKWFRFCLEPHRHVAEFSCRASSDVHVALARASRGKPRVHRRTLYLSARCEDAPSTAGLAADDVVARGRVAGKGQRLTKYCVLNDAHRHATVGGRPGLAVVAASRRRQPSGTWAARASRSRSVRRLRNRNG